jgi:histidine ammonia-lyase
MQALRHRAAEKEGLALINGTDGMLGMLILALADLQVLVDSANLIAAMSVEGLLGTDQVFRPSSTCCARTRPGAERGTHACCPVRLADRRLPSAWR